MHFGEHKIVFPKALEDIITTHNYGGDVSGAIARLIGNPKTIGETVHIAGAKPETWGRILRVYQEAIETKTGRKIKVYYADDLDELSVHFTESIRQDMLVESADGMITANWKV